MLKEKIYTCISLFLLMLLGSCATYQPETIPVLASATVVPIPTMTLPPTSTATQPPTKTPVPTATHTATLVPTETATATPTPSLFSRLPPGDYLVYSACLAGACEVAALSLAGQYQGILTREGNLSGSLSPNGRLMIFSDEQELLRILDLETHEFIPWEAATYRCYDPEWSSDGQHIATICYGEVGAEIYVFSLLDGTGLRLTNCAESGDNCGNPAWSPDGKWIAYNRAPDRSGVSATRGLYFMDTACFAEPATCMDTALGPFGLVAPQTWSPDSLYLAGVDGSTIHIFMLNDGTVSPFKDIETGGRSVETLSWSPDGQWLAYSLGNKINLISTDNWYQSFLYEADKYVVISGWITIPPKEE